MSAPVDLKLVDSEWELFRTLDKMLEDGWWPHHPPLVVMSLGFGWNVVLHGTGRYHYIDGTKAWDTLRFRVNITNELVERMLAHRLRRSVSA